MLGGYDGNGGIGQEDRGMTLCVRSTCVRLRMGFISHFSLSSSLSEAFAICKLKEIRYFAANHSIPKLPK